MTCFSCCRASRAFLHRKIKPVNCMSQVNTLPVPYGPHGHSGDPRLLGHPGLSRPPRLHLLMRMINWLTSARYNESLLIKCKVYAKTKYRLKHRGIYTSSPHCTYFGSLKKPCYAKLALVGL